MRTKISSKQILLPIALLGLTLSMVLFLYFFPKNPTLGSSVVVVESGDTLQNQEELSTKLPPPLKVTGKNITLPEPAKVPNVRVELPARLKIPRLDVDAPFEYVGLTPDGAMDVPKAPDEVAWFNPGPYPGENGSAVIAGHYGWKNNTPAVFDDLHKLRKGDKIFVENKGGVTMTFVVRETRIYKGDEAVPEVFGSNDGKAHLNLVTCTGVWNKDKETYAERLVVFTDRE